MGKYKNLDNLMKKQKVTKRAIADDFKWRYATVVDKLNGRSKLLYDEALAIKNKFFPTYDLEFVFQTQDADDGKKAG